MKTAEPKFRCGTQKAIKELASELNLPYDEYSQDWPYEIVKPADIKKYLEHYNTLTDDDKKFVLMQMIIEATNDRIENSELNFYWEEVEMNLIMDFNIHEYTIYYWCCFSTKRLEDRFTISPYMRKLWSATKK